MSLNNQIVKHFDSNQIYCEQYAQALWEQLGLLKNIQIKSTPKTETAWFKIGLLFANGEMDSLMTKYNGNTRAISRKIGMPNSRPYISESVANSTTSFKNIFNAADKIELIINYCTGHNIPIVDSFFDKANSNTSQKTKQKRSN